MLFNFRMRFSLTPPNGTSAHRQSGHSHHIVFFVFVRIKLDEFSILFFSVVVLSLSFDFFVILAPLASGLD